MLELHIQGDPHVDRIHCKSKLHIRRGEKGDGGSAKGRRRRDGSAVAAVRRRGGGSANKSAARGWVGGGSAKGQPLVGEGAAATRATYAAAGQKEPSALVTVLLAQFIAGGSRREGQIAKLAGHGGGEAGA